MSMVVDNNQRKGGDTISHYTEVKTIFKDKNCLVKALQDLGYHPEVGHDLPLYGYQGDRRAQTADIVVRRHEVGSAANDIGFKWNAKTKCYQQIISEFDAGQKRLSLAQLKRSYAPHKVNAFLKANRLKVIRKKEEGQRIRILARF